MLLVSVALAATPTPEQAATFTGSWRLAEARPVVQTRIDAALDAALAPFNVMVRGIARAPLSAATTFCDSYTIALTSSTFGLACDAQPGITVTLDAPAMPVSANGRSSTVAGAFDGSVVMLHFTGAEGWQRVRYRIDAGTFAVEKTIHAERLGADVTWHMRYTRG